MTNPKNVLKVIGSRLPIDKASLVVDLERSQGSWLVDARTGEQYLDCFSQSASQALGWNHPKMTAQKDRLADAAVNKVANYTYTTQFAEFVKKFSDFTPDFNHHFYVCSGSIAVENALEAAFDWKTKKMGISEEKSLNSLQVVYLKDAFHGRSGCFPKINWKKIHNPKIWHELGVVDDIKAKNSETMVIDEAVKVLEKRNVAAIIIEPIQGYGGDNHFRVEFLAELRRLADEYEALLIFDEVQTGLCLTGKTWAYEHFGVEPDIMCFGDKVQVGGFCTGDRINEFKKFFSTDCSTWGGNIVDMVRSTMQMEIIEDEDLASNAHHVGEYFLQKLKSFHGKASNIRGKGLMISFDLSTPEERDAFLKRLEKNMLALPCGQKSVSFRPHLTFSKLDVDEAISFITKAI